MKNITNDMEKRLNLVEILLLDVDGVLTDGSIIYNDLGREIKVFNVKDGLGLRLLMNAGIKVAVVTGRSSEVLNHRCNNLGIKYIFDNVRDKGALLPVISEKTGIAAERMAYVGDDLIDLPLMNRVGISMAVADSCKIVKNSAQLVTSAKGGRGAVREVCEAILKAKGMWKKIERQYINENIK